MEAKLVPSTDLILKATCSPVRAGADMRALVSSMYSILGAESGVGLAAPQVGSSLRVIIIRYGAVDMPIINPVCTPHKSTKRVTSVEGCLSFPGKQVKIKRHKRVTLTGFDIDWIPVELDLRNFLAFIAQHECDHLEGVTIV